VNIACSDPRIANFVLAVEVRIKEALADWPGQLTVFFRSCEDSPKRQEGSTVTTAVELDGDAATTAISAVDYFFTNNGTVDAGESVTGEMSILLLVRTGDSGLSGGQVAGIVVGCVGGATLVLLALLFFMRAETDVPNRT